MVAENAERLASRLYGSMDRYGFWLDDVRSGKCHCPKCRALSASDQQLLTCNAMAARLRKSRPQAQVAYLAYFDTLELPEQVQPAEGVFLEFAPMDKWNRLYGDAPRFAAGAAREAAQMPLLPRVFPRDTATVLEYWIDNSLFSQWKKPPKALTPPDGAAIAGDIAAYQKAGYRHFSVFGCFLGADYEALHGEPNLAGLTDAFQKQR